MVLDSSRLVRKKGGRKFFISSYPPVSNSPVSSARIKEIVLMTAGLNQTLLMVL
jgi:hypothetical protein